MILPILLPAGIGEIELLADEAYSAMGLMLLVLLVIGDMALIDLNAEAGGSRKVFVFLVGGASSSVPTESAAEFFEGMQEPEADATVLEETDVCQQVGELFLLLGLTDFR